MKLLGKELFPDPDAGLPYLDQLSEEELAAIHKETAQIKEGIRMIAPSFGHLRDMLLTPEKEGKIRRASLILRIVLLYMRLRIINVDPEERHIEIIAGRIGSRSGTVRKILELVGLE
jgi:hypothetical protein